MPRDHSPFADPSAHPEWLRAINSFAFLRHLRVADNIDAGARARALITGWLDGKARQDRSAWPVDVVARRVISWLSHAPMFLDGIGAQEHERFLRSLAAQTAFLKLAARFGPKGHPRLLACIAVAMAALCTGESKTRTARAGRRLAAEIQRQIFSDGGHVSRDPLVVAELLLDLLPLRQTYLATSVEPPENLMNAIERMMPMVRFFRHRDGTLARFNGCGASATAELATILAYDDTRGEPLRSAPHSGFERLTGSARR